MGDPKNLQSYDFGIAGHVPVFGSGSLPSFPYFHCFVVQWRGCNKGGSPALRLSGLWGKQGRDMNGVPAPKAIDEFIDELWDSSGTTLHQELDPIGDQSDGRL